MKRLSVVALTPLVLISLACQAAVAPQDSLSSSNVSATCYRLVASRVPPGAEITLLRRNGKPAAGLLRSVDLADNRLNLPARTDSVGSTLSFTPLEISSIRYSSSGHVRLG